MALHYTIEVSHHGLGKYRVVSGTDELVVRAKANALRITWDAEYRRKQAKEEEKELRAREKVERTRVREKQLNEKEKRAQLLEQLQQKAIDRTDSAREKVEEIGGILRAGLAIKHTIDWESLKRSFPYAAPKPAAIRNVFRRTSIWNTSATRKSSLWIIRCQRQKTCRASKR